ncbi:MAG: tetratricopeptide repeat protein [bacterium]|nr:tetratricopeptide repeat protein [bacterium]
MDDINAAIERGLELEKEGNEQQAIDYFLALAEQYPDHPRVRFEVAGAYDFAGREAEAVPHYRRAYELGVTDEYLLYYHIQLGSTLRNIGQFEEALELLRQGSERFPDDRAMRAFYALALFSAGRAGDALAEVLTITLDVPDFYPAYRRALRYYADEVRGK